MIFVMIFFPLNWAPVFRGDLLLYNSSLDGAEVLHPGHQHLGVPYPALPERLGHLSQREDFFR